MPEVFEFPTKTPVEVLDKSTADTLYSPIGGSVAFTAVTSDPATVVDGAGILNTTDATVKIGFGGVWWLLHTLGSYLTEDGDFYSTEDGTGIYILE